MKNSEYSDLGVVEKSLSAVMKITIEEDGLGSVVYVNDMFTEMTGYAKEDVTGRAIDKLLPDLYAAHHRNAVKLWINNQEKKILSVNN